MKITASSRSLYARIWCLPSHTGLRLCLATIAGCLVGCGTGPTELRYEEYGGTTTNTVLVAQWPDAFETVVVTNGKLFLLTHASTKSGLIPRRTTWTWPDEQVRKFILTDERYQGALRKDSAVGKSASSE